MVGNCPSGELSWLGIVLVGIVLVGSCPGGELSWLGIVLVGIVLVGSCPGGESYWGVVLVGNRPGGELSGWELSGGELSGYALGEGATQVAPQLPTPNCLQLWRVPKKKGGGVIRSHLAENNNNFNLFF